MNQEFNYNMNVNNPVPTPKKKPIIPICIVLLLIIGGGVIFIPKLFNSSNDNPNEPSNISGKPTTSETIEGYNEML